MTRDECDHGQLRRSCEMCELRAELAELRESIHYANGVADLAMKHRDAAEAKYEALHQRIESARMTTVRAGINAEATIYQDELPPSWLGKRVHLVVEDGE